MKASRTHLVLIPSYNAGPKVIETVRAADEDSPAPIGTVELIVPSKPIAGLPRSSSSCATCVNAGASPGGWFAPTRWTWNRCLWRYGPELEEPLTVTSSRRRSNRFRSALFSSP